MSFKKLNPEILEALETNGFEAPTPFQKKVIPIIKGGANVFCIGNKGCGKTTAIIISVMQKLKSKAIGDAPRALILVETKADALKLKEEFEKFTRRTDLRIYTAYDEQTLEQQREEVYYGQDILIATPKRLNKLYLLNSLDLSQLKMYILEDAEFAEKGAYFAAINRIPESIDKCQYLIFAEKLTPRLKRFEDTFMFLAQVIKQ
ncbi:DEAD/DEAH box helicase [Lacinutrix sp. MedPE-SW]|uniref:DEAD/DEAH box helicase n=1 Tax=Lacinutrix sp. MedPE-SW TaxID=1860087 RepID=UPI0009169956|nr:DEAD/DEAH box helicase [Lacinutrix sp. MedPE-SW]OIQ23951.1 MAG: DEAD/DEAH box helicase [Lacinutrix sp. MedPE-SW]